ncbi:MAG: hypothetical protein IJX97_03115, partial [Clostridia bacterium]|nr:hypothetical protein [Clostridia bacterium]
MPHTTKWYLAVRGDDTRTPNSKCNCHKYYPERQYPASLTDLVSVFFYGEEAVGNSAAKPTMCR